MEKTLSERDVSDFNQLMEWIKTSATSPRYTRLQNLGNGVVFCRLMAKICPGSLASVLIINRPANDNDSLHNYMLLEAAFGKAHLPWTFDSRKLIASNTFELLKLAKTLTHFRDVCKNRLQYQQRKLTPRANTYRPSRCPAGELDMPQHLTESQQPSVVSIKEHLEAVQQQLLTSQDKPQSAAGHVESQLKQQIQALFNSQQVAVAAFIAKKEPLATAPATKEATIVLCLCSNCVNKRKNLAIIDTN
ncbi:uncharacterized protein LOC117792137 isoform X2 [Drosophila innubila]|uniref:uncharacterized protein LOC117792137 isoform X2 n=1 Tax=Drosophila innubila TaxID=198719 RepID=UPI00148E0B2F|nr:uncharacterized protein LOC117792137 isoform X2 [Drosophila innubila]